jgi:hypothetical protein
MGLNLDRNVGSFHVRKLYYINLFFKGQQQGQQPGNQSSNATTTGSQQQTGTQSAGAISDEAFTQLVSGITGYMSQAAVGQAPRQTIAEFLSDLGQNYGIPQGEGWYIYFITSK